MARPHIQRLHHFVTLLLLLVAVTTLSADAFVVPLPHSPFQSSGGRHGRFSNGKSWTQPSGQRTSISTTQLELVPRTLTSPLLSVAALGAVIFVHECGHYVAARWFRIEVLEFSIGMGPKLCGFQAWGNDFSLRALPLGGYVKFAGDNELDDEQTQPERKTDSSRWLINRPWWERAVVVSGGVVFNMILTYLLYVGVLANLNQTLSLPKMARVTAAVMHTMVKETAMGIGGVFWEVIRTATSAMVHFWATLFQKFVALLGTAAPTTIPSVSPASMAEPLSKLSGPVRVVKAGSDVAYHQGIMSLLWFTGHLSLNLGVVNAFPLPVLDGGRLLFILIEAITGRKVDRRVEETANTLTTLLLLWLFFSTSWNDLRFLFSR